MLSYHLFPSPSSLIFPLDHPRQGFVFNCIQSVFSALLWLSPFKAQKRDLLIEVLHILNRHYLWELAKVIQYDYIFAYQVLGK